MRFDFEDFIAEGARYVREAYSGYGTLEFWLYPFGSLVAVYLLLLILPKVANQRGKGVNTFYLIRTNSIYAFVVVATILVGLFSYFLSTKYYQQHSIPLQFSHLLSLLIICSIPIIALLNIRKYNTSTKVYNLAPQPITSNSEEKSVRRIRKSFNKLKLACLIPLLGLLGLAGYLNKSNSLVSVVLDNSASMSEGQFDQGRQSLQAVFRSFEDNYTIIFLTTFSGVGTSDTCMNFPFTEERSKFSSVVSISDPSDLCGETVKLTPSEAIRYLDGVREQSNVGLNESIWQNFLMSSSFLESSSKPYSNRVLLIITDSQESPISYYDIKMCNDALEFGKHFDDNVYLVDIRNPDQHSGSSLLPTNFGFGFINIMNECYPGNIYDGYSNTDYSFALGEVLDRFGNKSPYLIWWLLIIYVIFNLTLWVAIPSKSN